jgi:8-oxo-dGTP pyrophosphatase MutT (NUDIX family)
VRQLNVSIGVLKQGNNYLLQLRGDDPKIGAAGKIGAFGGKIEDGETPVAAVCRELAEETSFNPSENEAKLIASYTIQSDHQLEDVSVHIDAFEINVADTGQVTAVEGSVVKLALDDIRTTLDKMTPATRHYFENVIGV